MDMVNTPCDMCKGCITPKMMEKLDLYESEYYFLALIALVIIVKICIIVLVNAIFGKEKM